MRLPTSLDLMPKPFEWIDIPAGTVALVDHHHDTYFGNKGQKVGFAVPAFTIARYPITNTQFHKFLDDDGYTNENYWTPVGLTKMKEQNRSEPVDWKNSTLNKDDHPVVRVSWYEGDAFCQWLKAKTGETGKLSACPPNSSGSVPHRATKVWHTPGETSSMQASVTTVWEATTATAQA